MEIGNLSWGNHSLGSAMVPHFLYLLVLVVHRCFMIGGSAQPFLQRPRCCQGVSLHSTVKKMKYNVNKISLFRHFYFLPFFFQLLLSTFSENCNNYNCLLFERQHRLEKKRYRPCDPSIACHCHYFGTPSLLDSDLASRGPLPV
jgi:hypothetical protein